MSRFGVAEAAGASTRSVAAPCGCRARSPYTIAADLLLTGRHITAPEAKEYGLIGHVVPDGTALTRALEIAETIAANGPLAVQAILKTMRDSEGLHEEEAFQGRRPSASACSGPPTPRSAPARLRTRRSRSSPASRERPPTRQGQAGLDRQSDQGIGWLRR